MAPTLKYAVIALMFLFALSLFLSALTIINLGRFLSSKNSGSKEYRLRLVQRQLFIQFALVVIGIVGTLIMAWIAWFM